MAFRLRTLHRNAHAGLDEANIARNLPLIVHSNEAKACEIALQRAVSHMRVAGRSRPN